MNFAELDNVLGLFLFRIVDVEVEEFGDVESLAYFFEFLLVVDGVLLAVVGDFACKLLSDVGVDGEDLGVGVVDVDFLDLRGVDGDLSVDEGESVLGDLWYFEELSSADESTEGSASFDDFA